MVTSNTNKAFEGWYGEQGNSNTTTNNSNNKKTVMDDEMLDDLCLTANIIEAIGNELLGSDNDIDITRGNTLRNIAIKRLFPICKSYDNELSSTNTTSNTYKDVNEYINSSETSKQSFEASWDTVRKALDSISTFEEESFKACNNKEDTNTEEQFKDWFKVRNNKEDDDCSTANNKTRTSIDSRIKELEDELQSLYNKATLDQWKDEHNKKTYNPSVESEIFYFYV